MIEVALGKKSLCLIGLPANLLAIIVLSLIGQSIIVLESLGQPLATWVR